MRDYEAGIDLVFFDPFEQRLHISLHVRLSGFKGQPLVHERAERDLVVEAAVHAGDRYGTAFTTSHDRLAKNMRSIRFQHCRLLYPIIGALDAGHVSFHADGVDASVGTEAAE